MDAFLFRFLNGLAGSSTFFDGIVAWSAQYLLWVMIAVPIALLFVKKGEKRQQFLPTFFLALGTFIVARGILTEIIRLAFYRPRPFLALPDVYLIPDLPYRLSASFPSGHAVSMFAIAFAFLPYNKKFAGILSTLALWSALCRVIAGVHYPSDILGGIILAYVVVWLVSRFGIRRFFPQRQADQLPQEKI
jgi:undecaprenyl-diphosphatase